MQAGEIIRDVTHSPVGCGTSLWSCLWVVTINRLGSTCRLLEFRSVPINSPGFPYRSVLFQPLQMSRKLPGVTPKSKADGKAGSPNNKNNTGDIDGSSSSEIKQNYLDLAYSSDASRDDEEAGSLEPSPGNSSGRSAPKGGESPKAGMNGIGHRVIENGIKRKVESSASQNGNGIHEHAALPSASPSKANGTPNKRRKLHDTPSKEKRKSEWAARKNVLQREQQLVRKSADNLPVNEGKLFHGLYRRRLLI